MCVCIKIRYYIIYVYNFSFIKNFIKNLLLKFEPQLYVNAAILKNAITFIIIKYNKNKLYKQYYRSYIKETQISNNVS